MGPSLRNILYVVKVSRSLSQDDLTFDNFITRTKALFAGMNLWESKQWKPSVHSEIRLVFLPAELPLKPLRALGSAILANNLKGESFSQKLSLCHPLFKNLQKITSLWVTKKKDHITLDLFQQLKCSTHTTFFSNAPKSNISTEK